MVMKFCLLLLICFCCFALAAKRKQKHIQKKKMTPKVRWRESLGALLFDYSQTGGDKQGGRNQQKQELIDCDNSDNTEKACLRDVRKYFDNIRDVLKYRIKQLDGFENKLKRFTRFNKLINKKAAKAGDFANVTDFLLAALGNNPDNMTCMGAEPENFYSLENFDMGKGPAGKQEESKQEKLEQMEKRKECWQILSNCSANITQWCQLENSTLTAYNETLDKSCRINMNAIIKKTQECRNLAFRGRQGAGTRDEQAKCFCYESAKLLVDNFASSSCITTMETEVKKVKAAKDNCLNAFGNCRKEENAAFFIINDCSHRSVPILTNNRSLAEYNEEFDDEEEDDYFDDDDEDFEDF